MVRSAKISDALVAIDLIDLALENISSVLTGEENKEKAKSVLREFFVSKQNLYSFENVFVYEINGLVVGAMCVYDSNLRDKLLEPIISRLKMINKNHKIDKECFENEYYIDTIAVNEKFRKRGIATKMFEHAFLEAKKLDIKKCSLVVDILKPKTKSFYESLGFYQNCVVDIAGGRYFHMLKDIK
ncbi:GNAT family N-acetyltransferase [Campylobacter sp. RM12327]|uniref:Acetyltransferase n=1 Tax=Campylobacter sputorum subsp. sputorum TaxID=32024 RepID=A0A381DL94_9BACT|nr:MULTISPECIES: GNAT family N-acetyltransferase [Campylobacter]ASM34804.1 acetyltransferase [Campylobacter sputorum aubsp. sputorum RM3237]ASM36468.1 acetyltransferase [Campylobacter sputorum bv. faecalis CCUG 20703]ASM38163.1 acetyltransferase [Campylobacter sputorum bv. paraureolyticus LMG 11764]ASM39789.1 acetyltransferase [Campylobacter sputorum]KAB0581640.1 GNAT family N-acetyltransferase [Campylobacter sputorum subsp. sputorum]